MPISPTSSNAARGSTRDRLGGRLIVAASLLAAVVVVLAVVYAAAPRPSGASPGAAAPKLSPSAARYLGIADAANHKLEVANDGYKKNERDNLAAAESDLRAEVAVESRFDKQLAEIPFPLSMASIVRALILANQQRGALAARQARSASLTRLRSFDSRHQATDAAVEVQVKLIRKALHLPPPSTS